MPTRSPLFVFFGSYESFERPPRSISRALSPTRWPPYAQAALQAAPHTVKIKDMRFALTSRNRFAFTVLRRNTRLQGTIPNDWCAFRLRLTATARCSGYLQLSRAESPASSSAPRGNPIAWSNYPPSPGFDLMTVLYFAQNNARTPHQRPSSDLLTHIAFLASISLPAGAAPETKCICATDHWNDPEHARSCTARLLYCSELLRQPHPR